MIATRNGRRAYCVYRRPSVITSGDALEVLDCLADAGITAWLDGGWGIDALLGEQTRPHADLDVAIARDDCDRARERLEALGYRQDPEAEPGLPARLVLRDDRGRQVDLHPLVFDAEGNGWQQLSARGAWGCYPAADLAASGTIAGRLVRCISAQLQLRFHLGHEWNEREQHDLRLLNERFGTPLPPQLRRR
jgi:lincosamide nucleotidyltransferase A/C/D/E